MKLTTIVLAMAAYVSPSYANSDCGTVPSTERSACIAALAERIAAGVLGKWVKSEPVKDRITDEVTTYAHLFAESASTTKIGEPGQIRSDGRISVACTDGSAFAAVIFTSSNQIATPKSKVSYRVDQNRAQIGRLEASIIGGGVGIWDSSSAAAFVRELKAGKKLIVRIEDPLFGKTEADFDVSNSARDLKDMNCFENSPEKKRAK